MVYKSRQLILVIFISIILICIPIIGSYEFNSSDSMFRSIYFQKRFSGSVLVVIFFYLNYFYLIPKYYFTKRYWLYFTIIIVYLILVIKLPDIIISDYASRPENIYHKKGFRKNMGSNGFSVFRIFYDRNSYQFFISFCISILLRLNIRMSAINDEKLKSELSYLKAQINPHFLFNTLNSLYALSLEKSDQAPDAILKLSNIMRYVVTESSNDFVPLHRELNYIKDYIELQKLRMADVTNLDFKIEGSDFENKKIAPLLFIPFIENAFKYGLNPEKKSKISIEIKLEDNELFLNITNDKTVVNVREKDKTETGMENTKRRLRYHYPEKHTFQIAENSTTYNLKLKLYLR